MTLTRTILNPLAAVLLAVTVAACGDDAADNMESGQSKAASTTEQSGTPVAAAERQPQTITVYSSRNEDLIQPVFEAYTEATGTEVRFITDSEGPLLARLDAEGENTPADLLVTVDAGNLWRASEMGLLQPVQSEGLNASVPEHLRDPQGEWFGLAVRARTLFYNPANVDVENLSTYEALADAAWQDRLCLRTSKKVYNQSLVAMLIAEHGEEATQEIVEGWVNNLAAPPFPNDTQMLEAIAAGQCDVGIANTYYYGRLLKDNPDISLKPFWPNQNGAGVHVNITGAGVTAHAPNPEAATHLLAWMASDEAQNLFADRNMEYPVNPEVDPAPIVAEWGEFNQNLINVSRAGELQADAVKLMDRAGYK